MEEAANITLPKEEDRSRDVEYMLTLFVVIGVLGNGLAVCVFARKKEKLPHTIFILTLAIVDFVTCSLVIPIGIYMIHAGFRTNSDLLCKLYHFLITSNVPFSAFIMVAISVERYLSVCHPFLHLMKPKNTKITILILLLFACSLGVITSLAYGISNDCENSTQLYAYADISQNFSYSKEDMDPFLKLERLSPDNSTLPYGQQDNRNSYCDVGTCSINYILFSKEFLLIYQKIYASLYLLSFLSTLVLYGLIYRCVFWRRAKRWKTQLKQRQILSSNGTGPSGMSVTEATMTDCRQTELVVIKNPSANAAMNSECPAAKASNEGAAEADGNRETEIILKKGSKLKTLKRQTTMKDKNRFANFKLAVMLFVVNLVFIAAFLPAWLMAIQVIKYTPLVFYAYFCYNVANPLIYAFMNPSFRKDLWSLICLFGQNRSDRQYL